MLIQTANRWLPWVAYPIGVLFAVGMHYAMLSAQVGLEVSTYVPVFSIAILITLFECVIPYQTQWKPSFRDIKTDATYMLLVQTALPKILGFLVSLYLLRAAQDTGFVFAEFWPHHFPIWLQAIMMILIADFLRYWFHVASHKNSFLWRFHAVHHSPEKLYWINTGRFHPIEKAFQFVFDALPFIVLSVSEQVLALYFVFYAANGFFQHSNIKLRFGILNYIISSAELHRWHHSKLTNESNSNYGNNTIVWDILFGTRFLPKEREVKSIGVINLHYPMTFTKQLITPFVRRLDKKNIPLPNLKNILVNGLIYLKMLHIRATSWQSFIRATKHPEQAQEAVLKRILSENKSTEFGKQYQFTEINSYEDFKKKIPLQTYDSLQDYFLRQDQSSEPIINSHQPRMFSVTSGTTGAAKHVPITNAAINENKRHQMLFTYAQYKNYPEAFTGKMLGIVGSAIEGHTKAGTPYGAVSGVLYECMPSILKSKYVLPDKVFSIKDYKLKYKTILRLALAHNDITYIASANPSTFLLITTLLNEYKFELVSDIELGKYSQIDDIDKEVRDSIKKCLNADPQRAKELRNIFEHKDEIALVDIWPHLQMIVTWGGGSCGVALDAVKRLLPAQTKILELGYLATEVRGTITIDTGKSMGVPTIQDNYFEFIERNHWEQGKEILLTLDQLKVGKEYYVIVTTSSGLYRYFMNDIVKVTGKFNETPTLEFIQKGNGVTNITGEKLSEIQVIQAVKNAEANLSFSCVNFIALADKENSLYKFYIELVDGTDVTEKVLQNELEKELFALNIEYKEKHASSRLNPLEANILKPGTIEAYKQDCLQKGQREGQFKYLVLQYKDENDFPFDCYTA